SPTRFLSSSTRSARSPRHSTLSSLRNRTTIAASSRIALARPRTRSLPILPSPFPPVILKRVQVAAASEWPSSTDCCESSENSVRARLTLAAGYSRSEHDQRHQATPVDQSHGRRHYP